jgi:MoxR-like ATPase
MSQVSLDALEMKDFLKHIIENNRYIQSQGKTPVSTEVIGDSGLGKTSIVLQMAKEYDLNFVKLNLAQIEEIGDLVGFPVRQFQMSSGTTTPTTKLVKDANGNISKVTVPAETKLEWIDETAVDEYSKQGYKFTGQKRMSYCPPEWIADKKGGGILILDDWNRAD